MRKLMCWQDWTRKLRHVLTASALVIGFVGVPAVVSAIWATPVAAAACTPGNPAAPVGTPIYSGSCWLGGNGVEVYGDGPGGSGKYQCSELVVRLYKTRGWVTSWSQPNGDQVWDTHPANLKSQANGSVTYLGPGDAISMEVYYNGKPDPPYVGLGHVAVVNTVTATGSGLYKLQLVNQNAYAVLTTGTWNSTSNTVNGIPAHSIQIGSSGNYTYPVDGVVHAPSSVTSTSPILSSISSLQTPDGYIHVFSGNATGSVWETWFGNGHSPTSDLLGTPTGSPITSISSMYTSDGYIHVFAGMQSGAIYEFYFGNGNAPKWDLLGNPDGQPITSVSSMQTSDGYIHVFSSTKNGYVWETYFGNGNAPKTDQLANLSGSEVDTITSLQTTDGYIHVFSGNATGSVWETWFGNGHSPTSDLLGTPDGSAITSVSSMHTSDGYVHVFSSTADGYVWETYFGNGNAPKTDQLANLSG